MSDREAELFQNIFCSIHVTIMLTATSRTNPVSYSKACDTFRPRVGQCAAIRADLGGKTFIHFFKPCAMLNSLVRQLIPEGRPTCIEYRLCHVGFSQSGGIDVAYRNIVKLLNDAMREFVVKIISSIRRSRLYRLDATFLSRSLCNRKRLFCAAIDALRFDLFTRGQNSEVFQTEINPDTTDGLPRSDGNCRHVNDDIEKPVASSVLREVRAVLNLAFRQGAAIEDTKRMTSKTKRVALPFQFTTFQWHPTQMFLATVAQVGSFLLGSRFSVLLTNRVHGAGVQTQVLATALCQFIQVKAGVPAPSKTQSVFLPIVAIIPDEVTCSGLPVKQSCQGLDAVTIDKNHTVIIYSTPTERQRLLAQPAPFTPRPKRRGFSEQI